MGLSRIAAAVLVATFVAPAAATVSDTAARLVPFQPAPSPYVVIAVPIKGHGCAAFLFDTGTNLSILAPDLAGRLAAPRSI